MVNGILFLLAVTAIWGYLAMTRRSRRRWEQRLSLPGEWRVLGARDGARIRFMGKLTSGTYVQTRRLDTGLVEEQGRWWLRGASIHLAPDGGQPQPHELRLFADGTVGIDGPTRRHWVLERLEGGNVVPLRVAHPH